MATIAADRQDTELLTALAATSDAELLRQFARFTHRMHANSTSPKLAKHGETLRAQRDLLEAEILRRMADR